MIGLQLIKNPAETWGHVPGHFMQAAVAVSQAGTPSAMTLAKITFEPKKSTSLAS